MTINNSDFRKIDIHVYIFELREAILYILSKSSNRPLIFIVLPESC